jgi:Carboxypeptidase regulatory-like domain/TonB dependent receptor
MARAVRSEPFWAYQLCLVACVLACAVATAAQTPTAVLEGTVEDVSGGVIANVSVEARNLQTNQRRMTLSDGQGRFRFTDVPVGTYEVRAVYDGFEPYEHVGVTLAIGQTARLNVAMRPAGVIESVAVSAQPPALDSRQTSVTTTIDVERIEELPVRSRNYLEFVLLAPGVTRSGRHPTPGGVTSPLQDSGFSFGGLRPRSNTLTIDGLDNNDEFTGSTRTELSLEFVREFQVVTNGWSVENGGASGGGINVVTKSGANTLHGDAFLFGQFGMLNARPKLEETLGDTPTLRRYRGGLAVGGPLVKDRTFYFAAAEREQTHDQTASDISPAAAGSINSALNAGLFPQVQTRQLTIGLFPTARAETEWAGKLTHQLERRGALVGRIAATHNREEHDAFNSGGLSDRSARGTRITDDVALTGSWMAAVNARTTNELRGQLATRRVDLSGAEQDGAGVSIAGVADFGSTYAGNNTHDHTYVEFGDTAGHSRGSHFLKAGANVRHVSVSGATMDGVRGLYTFRTLDAFLAGRFDTMRTMSAAAEVDLSVTRASAFIQDHWTPTPVITVDAGVRFDASRFPSSLGITNRLVSPRVGLAWTPAANWVVRAGAGLFADRFVLAAVERGWLAQQDQIVEYITDGPPVSPSLYTVRRGAWNPSSRQASVGAERQLTANLTASINYLFVRGHHLPRTNNVNLPPPTTLTIANAASLGVDDPVPQQLGRPVFGPQRTNPSWDAIFELEPTASSAYHGMTLALNKRLANEIEWSAAYTWSHAKDSASDFDEQPQNPHALGEEWSDSRYDQRHRLVVSALFDVPIGEEEDRSAGEVPSVWIRALSHIEVAAILTVGSGLPANVTTGADDNRTGAFPFTSRPLTVGRHSWRLPSSATLDMRMIKYFNIKPHGKLDLVVEAFNVLNRTNVTQVNTVYGPLLTPLRSFGRAIEAGSARQFQFSIDFEF